jgi:cadmium resistance protein CadD (predicted permease)
MFVGSLLGSAACACILLVCVVLNGQAADMTPAKWLVGFLGITVMFWVLSLPGMVIGWYALQKKRDKLDEEREFAERRKRWSR